MTADKTRSKKFIERRTAGIKAMPAPKARPLPDNHPARSIFRSFSHPDQTEETASDAIGIPEGIPTTTPEGIPISSPLNSVQPSPTESKMNSRHEPANRDAGTSPELFTPLDATHTSSEKNIYSLMYRDTISKGVRDRHFGPAELMRKSGIRSRNTVHKALYGLIEKLSVEVISKANGNPLGPRYRVYKPKEIEQRRKSAGMIVDMQTKKAYFGSGIPIGIPKGIPDTPPDGIPVGVDKNWDTDVPIDGTVSIPKNGIPYKEENTIGGMSVSTASSSSNSAAGEGNDDDAFYATLSAFYEQVTGNTWTTADASTARSGRDIPVEVWGIAICYCLDRAPRHRFERLAYVLEEARNHYAEMKDTPLLELRAIMRHSARAVERARMSGKWEPAETPVVADE